ncbi:MAG: sulfotransferase domain-containing protein, partial [bacterium]
PTHIIYKEVRYHYIIKNLLEQDDTLQVIGLVRNPMAALNSWLNSPREFRKDLGWDPLSEWRLAPSKNQDRKEEYYGYEKWKEVTLLFLQLKDDYPDNFYLVKYNELLKHPKEVTEKLFSFVGLGMMPATEEFLIESRIKNDNETYGIYRSHKTDDQWKKSLDQTIVDAVQNDLNDTVLEQFLH